MARTPEPSREIVVVGRSCRLPGAASVGELWSNLLNGRCSITEIPDDRWSKEKHGHPRPKEPGKSYTWAAGVLDDIWAFDPAPFGISPREAEQMDPQQRLVLELTWEALEDAGIPRSTIAGSNTGVYVGASGFDFSVVRSTDMAAGDAYTATGGALSIISNRISHVFDLKGPSFTVDTACSSSLVALHQAMEAIRSGRIDTAVVGGVNVLLSPFGFVTFSQASMLSPTGRCYTFDSRADGYVRAEGGVFFILKTLDRALKDDSRIYGRLVASGINSDGHTNGIALPSRFAQAKLLEQVYSDAGIDLKDVAFVEAHGTGTRVGDPIEAHTIGSVLAGSRDTPLKIGSIKSNIGHLEPASGLAGVLKALLALEHDVLPPSVSYSEPNPDIPFDELNLEVCRRPASLAARGKSPRYAGVNSFGFGGTNAHVVVSDSPARETRGRRYSSSSDRFSLSAANRASLRDLARVYSGKVSTLTSEQVQEIAAAAIHRREAMTERVVVEWRSPRDLSRKLERFADKDDDVAGVISGAVTEYDAPVAFVFSGNGGQWPGMGRSAYAGSLRFREAFDEIDATFDREVGWSIVEALFANDIAQRIRLTHIAQPLIFALQVATARALSSEGLDPSFVVGHSVGEIAAAAVSGALSLADAVRVIHSRSAHQEMARDAGRMAAVVGTREQVEDLVASVGNVEFAAINSPRTFTVAGPTERIKALGSLARSRRIVFRQLDLDYPFHCHLIDPVRDPLMKDLRDLKARTPAIPFISTVTGDAIEDDSLDGHYWWRNVREPVLFSSAIEKAARRGARIFVEIGPRSVLTSNINETLEQTSLPFAPIGVLEKTEEGDTSDPIRPAVSKAFVRGAKVELDKLFGPEPSRAVPLPFYQWQRRSFRPSVTPEAVGHTLQTGWHRLIGARHSASGVEWVGLLDSTLLPELADHEVGGQAILPGAAFIEIALTVARDWFDTDTASILELDIAQALPVERDSSKELMARLSPQTGAVEIMSRPRLSQAEWQLHAVAKISRGLESEPDVAAPPSVGGQEVHSSTVYAAAASVGLNYGPAFRLAKRVVRHGPDRIVVDLHPSVPAGRYRIDPAALDACFHGLFILFGELSADARGSAYIPVRFGHTRVLQPSRSIARAEIAIRKATDRSIVADFHMFDDGDKLVATISDARFQAARIRRVAILSERALSLETVKTSGDTLGRSGADVTAARVRDLAAELGLLASADVEGDGQLLLEGWATAAAYELTATIAEAGAIGAELLDALPVHLRAWLTSLLRSLEGSGLASLGDDGWTLEGTSALPESALVLRTIAAENPDRSTELLLASAVEAAIGRHGLGTSGEVPVVPSSVIDAYQLDGTSVREAAETVALLLDRSGALAADGRGLRVLQVGYGPLSHGLLGQVGAHAARLTILETDRRRLERGKIALGPRADVAFLAGDEPLVPSSFDVVVSAHGLHLLGHAVGLADLRTAIAPGGLLVAVEPLPSAFRDLALGLTPDWFNNSASSDFPVGPVLSEGEWASALVAAGFSAVATGCVRKQREGSILLVGETDAAVREQPAVVKSVHIHASQEAGELAGALDSRFKLDGYDVHFERESGPASVTASPPDIVLFVARPDTNNVVRGLREAALALRGVAESCNRDKSELWVLVTARRGNDALADPSGVALVSFARTLANEYPTLKVRRVLVDAATSAETAAAAIATFVSTGGPETDLFINGDACSALRVRPLSRPKTTERTAAKLERGAVGGLGGLDWTAIPRNDPGAQEVEIEVEASGLNFRDVMWALSLLPDEVLEDGFAGPTLGLECAGIVRRVGSAISTFSPGDRVVAFAPSAFSTHVNVPAAVVMPIADGTDTEAAATVPVAFLTAYYGLVSLAQMKAGEWVLIHGAAGGVGMAAVQIAQWRGANIIATAGSDAKRHLLRSLGVEHVLNSRSSGFADELRGIVPAGVDIVLNSLSGEAMERGLSTLKAFGRFIELGKRDYVANTHIGLRPFRRNLSYFGVDVDQLLSDENRASDVFAEVMGLVGSGALRPLPYRVYPAEETVDAFRLMQQSGHVGKILLRPPADAAGFAAERDARFDPERTHIVTGGFGGFGLEAARWLADKGARHLVLIGRNGPSGAEAQALVADLQASGVSVNAAACDVADEATLTALLSDVRRSMPPIAGIMHAAMVLDDSLLINLTAEQLTSVLTPKVQGAENLDRLTRRDPLDYFVLFSSITTIVGNPGQAAYVAANGYLEGLARLRREEGRPALAVAWGAIADVGILAREKGLAESLARRVGVKAMPAREALDLMAQALGRSDADPVMAIGSLDWSAARRLPALASPTFAALTREGSVVDAAERKTIDLRTLLATTENDKVRKQVAEIIVEEIAGVLRVPKEDVSVTKKLAEIGLDSLMAIELAGALQERFELSATPSGSVGTLSVFGLAEHIMASASGGSPDEEARVTQALNDRHGGVNLDAQTLAPLAEAMTHKSREMKGLLQ